MSKLPYATSKTDPVRAQQRIRATLQKFGVSRIAFDEDFKACELVVRFIYKEYPVSLPVDYARLAELYLEEDPWTTRKFKSRDEWEADKREVAYRAAFSLIEDYLKSMVTIVEMGVFSFEEIFVSYFIDKRGKRLGEYFKAKLPELVAGKALPEGKIR